MTIASAGKGPKGASESKKSFYKTWWFPLLLILAVVLAAVFSASLYLYNSRSNSDNKEGDSRSSGADSSITQNPSSGSNKGSSGEEQKKDETSTAGTETQKAKVANQQALQTALFECARKLSSVNSETVILSETVKAQQSGNELSARAKAKMIPNGSQKNTAVFGIAKCEFQVDTKTKAFTLKEKGSTFELLTKSEWEKWH